ncbi:Proline-rich protein LAS17, partial [Smittium culicis]
MSSATLSQAEDKAIVKSAQPASSHKILTATVSRLYAADFNTLKWKYTKLWGALILVKDLLTNSYFLRMISFIEKRPVWEQELYVGFKLNVSTPFFCTFPGDEFLFGFDFSSEEEAVTFCSKVNGRGSKIQNNSNLSQESLEMIQNPRDPRWKLLISSLSSYGVTESQLEERKTREFIMNFVSEHGGVDGVTRKATNLDSKNKTSQPSPSQPPPPPPPPSSLPSMPSKINTPSTNTNGYSSPQPAIPSNPKLPPPPPPPQSTRRARGPPPPPPPASSASAIRNKRMSNSNDSVRSSSPVSISSRTDGTRKYDRAPPPPPPPRRKNLNKPEPTSPS